MDLASRIQQLRKEAGFSQEALAEMLGISRQALGKWESGASLPTLENLTQLAKIFHLSIDELITGQHEPKNGEDNPALHSETVNTLLQRIEQIQKRRAPVPLLIVMGIIGTVLVFFTVFSAIRIHMLDQQYNTLAERIDALASQPIDTASLYQQILDRLQNDFSASEPDQFYFDWELLGCDLQNKTMTIFLRAIPREFSLNDTLSFLLSPASGTSDTLDASISIAAVAQDGQFSAQAEIPLCSELEVYIQYGLSDGTTRQELAAQLYDLSTQFIPYFEAESDTFGFRTWNYTDVYFFGSPAVSVSPALSSAAPKPIQIECKLFYNDSELFSQKIDVSEVFSKIYTDSSDTSDSPAPSSPTGSVTFYPSCNDLENQHYDYISDAEVYWLFTLTDSAGNHYERRLSITKF